MTYGELKRFVMELIDQYSARGVALTREYNDQADFLSRIPGLYNAAMLEMALGPAPLLALLEPEAAEVSGEYVRLALPEDFLRLQGDGPNGQMGDCIQRGGQVYLRRALLGRGKLEYWRAPKVLEPEPPEDETLDGSREMQTAAAYYAAAMLVLREDAFVYAALRNEYDDRLTAMKKRIRAERLPVIDCYGLGLGPY